MSAGVAVIFMFSATLFAATSEMTAASDQLATIIAVFAFVIYVGGLLLASLRQIARLLAYWKGWIIRHDFTLKGPRTGSWRRGSDPTRSADGQRHNRWFPLWIEHIPPSPVPDLLKRDIWFTLGIAWPFAASLTARVLISANLLSPEAIVSNAAWYLVTGGPAVAAVIAYTYYEWFRIERIDVEQEIRRSRVRDILTRRGVSKD